MSFPSCNRRVKSLKIKRNWSRVSLLFTIAPYASSFSVLAERNGSLNTALPDELNENVDEVELMDVDSNDENEDGDGDDGENDADEIMAERLQGQLVVSYHISH